MASNDWLPRATSPKATDRPAFKPGAVMLLVPVILLAGVLMAFVLGPPLAGISFGVKTLDARLAAAGADFTRIPRFPTKSTIYASDAKTVLATVYLDNRELVRLDKVSEPAKEAVLAIEDSGFYQHGALNWNSMIRALVENARAGTVVQGGSTITQQLVKNSLQNTDSRTFANKFQEMAISLRVEQEYTKDQIFELYLNQIYLGNSVYGIETASDFYFHKPASRLTLAEGAMLAGIIRAPAYYDPVKDPANMLLRRNDVLNAMMRLGWMTPAENAVEKAKPLGLAKNLGKRKRRQHLPYFVTYTLRQILATNPMDPQYNALGKTYQQRKTAIYEGGLRIYTTLNSKWQAAAQTVAQQPYAVYAANPGYYQTPDTAIVTLDNATGAVRTMLSGRNYDNSLHPKDLVSTRHEPGSSFKPYVLAAAFEEGIPPTQTYSTKSPLYLPQWTNACHCVYNAEGAGNEGYVNLYRATASSINVVFAQLIFDVGPDNVAKVAEQMMGMKPGTLQVVPALAVGEVPISPLEQASGYQTIANGGMRCKPYTVERIEDADGLVLQHTPDCYRVLTPGIADQITSMLVGVVTGGTGTAANLGTWPTAGKTGTAQDNKAVWFAGFTKQETTAVWVGFPGNQDSLTYYFGQSVFGGTVSAPIWHAYMLSVMAGMPPLGFPAPPLVTTTPSPPASKPVPDVVGKPLAAATSILSQAGFGASVTMVSDAAPKGTVVAQSPAAGADGFPGSSVVLSVSTGVVRSVKVPDVVGMDQDAAIAALQQLGFLVGVITQKDPLHIGIVLSESPSAGTKVDLGSDVTITVGSKH